MDIHTAKFQTAIPYTLLAISPALSDLHTRRTHQKDTELVPENCPRCGVYLFAGDSSTRVVRTKRRRTGRTDTPNTRSNKNTRARQTTCFQSSLFPRRKRPISQSNVNSALEQLPASIYRTLTSSASTSSIVSTTTVAVPSPKAVVASTIPRSKSRPKKKTGLQEMLAHNRVKEEKARNASAATRTHSGLAAFLDSL
ncbi:hypothetical protein BT96DRAFT_912749 [Gymnopus androsaceus JB14]|uniref:Uncharacterized protein n=1 Tax=Gymnopus androsaceus JB14 TaxID=1447944 RepID=A0A6A4IEB5_9AGAR|nr:hypothetical protein BT96DRAFT_912749 [Gymnopus androsaceus JB14]